MLKIDKLTDQAASSNSKALEDEVMMSEVHDGIYLIVGYIHHKILATKISRLVG